MALDLLDTLISSFNAGEMKEFKHEHEPKSDSKEYRIYDLVRSKVNRTPAQMSAKIYGTENIPAYQALRKRALNKLEDYIARKRIEKKLEHTNAHLLDLELAEYCISRKLWDAAKRYLREAKESAEKHQYREHLNSIYRLQMEHSRYLETDIPAVDKAWSEIIRRQNQYRQLTTAVASVQRQLDEAKVTGAILDPQIIKRQVLGQFRLEKEERTNAEFMYQLTVLFRNALVSTKDYYRIEDLVGKIYSRLLEGKAFHDGNRDIQINMLFLLAQAFYRNCRFDRAEETIFTATELLPVRAPHSHPLYLQIANLHITVLGYSRRVPEAIVRLRNELQSGLPDRVPRERANMWLNLAMCEFISGEIRPSIRTIHKITQTHNAAWLRKNLGQEWTYKMELVEVVLLWDGGQEAVAETKLDQMLVRYKDFLKGEIYERGAVFMKFVQRYFRDPDILKSPEFLQEIKAASLNRHEHEDIHAITFFCWFKSKIVGLPFYEVLQERIAEQGQYHR